MTVAWSGANLGMLVSQPATRALSDTSLSSSQEQRRRRRWNHAIDFRLVEWATRAPAPVIDDEDAPPPSRVAIDSAIEFAIAERDNARDGMPAPEWISGTGDGGIVFRWGTLGEWTMTFEFGTDGSIELFTSENCRITSRTRLR